ncbi:MAG: TRAP transporter substrate-binding protein DctP [Gammaproteobacteria bacterium]
MISRRTLYSLVVFLGLIAGCLPAAHAKTFKIATLAPDGTTWMQEMRAAADQIEKQTEGRVRFKFYTGGVMGNDQAVLRKMRIGQLQGGALTSGSLAGVFPDIQIFNIPFLFDSYKEANAVRAEMDGFVRDGLKRHGLVTLGISSGGFAYVMSNTPIRNIEELRTHKIWVPQGDAMTEAIFQEMGDTPIPLAMSDVYMGLQTGMIDTVEVTPTAAIALQWYTKLGAVTDVPLAYLMGIFVVNRRDFERLSPADRTVVKKVLAQTFNTLSRLNEQDNQKALQVLKQRGLQLVRPQAEELDRWHALAGKVTIRLSREGTFSQAAYQTLEKHIKAYRQQHASK